MNSLSQTTPKQSHVTLYYLLLTQQANEYEQIGIQSLQPEVTVNPLIGIQSQVNHYQYSHKWHIANYCQQRAGLKRTSGRSTAIPETERCQPWTAWGKPHQNNHDILLAVKRTSCSVPCYRSELLVCIFMQALHFLNQRQSQSWRREGGSGHFSWLATQLNQDVLNLKPGTWRPSWNMLKIFSKCFQLPNCFRTNVFDHKVASLDHRNETIRCFFLQFFFCAKHWKHKFSLRNNASSFSRPYDQLLQSWQFSSIHW